MTVEQLIEQLRGYDPQAMVVVRGYEAGVDEVSTVESSRVRLHAHSERYYGKHELTDDDTIFTDPESTCRAVFLSA